MIIHIFIMQEMITSCFDTVYKKKLLEVAKTVAEYLQTKIHKQVVYHSVAGLQSLQLHAISDGFPDVQEIKDEDGAVSSLGFSIWGGGA